MKRILIICLIIFNFSSVFSQDMIKAFKQQILEIDSLQKQVIKPLNDSIIKLNSAHEAEISKFNKQIEILENDTFDLNNKVENLEFQITELNENKVKVERDSLQTKVESLSAKVTELEEIISQKEGQLEKEIQFGEQNAMKEKEKGRQEVLNSIIQTYNKPFDELIIFSTISSVERDLSIVRNNNEAQQKLLNLQKYFFAKQVLSEKYNKQNVNFALDQISSLEQTKLVKNLVYLLRNYKLHNDALIATINKILERDKIFVANEDEDQKIKLNYTFELAWYFRNYRFNFYDYPYLSDIVLEIIKQKQKDANTDISNFLDEL